MYDKIQYYSGKKIKIRIAFEFARVFSHQLLLVAVVLVLGAGPHVCRWSGLGSCILVGPLKVGAWSSSCACAGRCSSRSESAPVLVSLLRWALSALLVLVWSTWLG